MSSHHIVREGQEPALIIANGQACSMDLLNQLLEWSPFIVVLDGALSRVLELGIKFDVALGDFDGLNIDTLRDQIPPDTAIEFTPDQNKTDLEKGIEYLIKNLAIIVIRMKILNNFLSVIGNLRSRFLDITVIILTKESLI